MLKFLKKFYDILEEFLGLTEEELSDDEST